MNPSNKLAVFIDGHNLYATTKCTASATTACSQKARARSPFAWAQPNQCCGAFEVTWVQNSRGRSTLVFAGLPAMMAALMPPIEMPAIQSGSMVGFIHPSLILAERATALQYRGHSLERKKTLFCAEVRLGLSVHFRSRYRRSNRCLARAGARAAAGA
jgi:hypothetical protein